MMRVDGAWKPAEAVRDPRGPIWPSATSIQGFLPEPKHNLLEAQVPVDLELPTQRGGAGGERQKRERKQTSFYDPQKIAADAAATGAVEAGEPGGAAGGGGGGGAGEGRLGNGTAF